MRLFFDIGNTRTKWGVGQGDQIISQGALVHADFDAAVFFDALSLDVAPDSVWGACVGPDSVRKAIDRLIFTQFAQCIQWVEVTQQVAAVSNAYADLRQLGVDRWVAALGAYHLMSVDGLIDTAAIIIDAGTAVTIDFLDVHACFQGGVILPGLMLMHDSLVGRTAGIQSSATVSTKIIGKTTQECVNSGASYGLVGAVERVVLEMQKIQQSDINLFITGGDANAIIAKTDLSCRVEPNLVLNGLMLLSKHTPLL